jgi:acyl-[acyl-carrier-protein]-phospholipid O-acyltransferase/long-chain-fatty-acid--[acyl-carrier-protein] ligase
MYSNQLYLFKDIRFLPIFIVQFCGCLNDSILKNALIILVTYKLSNEFGHSQFLILLANTIFILPFAVFASLAGQVADRYERSFVVKIIKLLEVIIVLLAAYGFIHNSLNILFSCICLMGIHSAFFGPIKYSVLPDHLEKSELLGANGFVEAGTFVSILVGTIIGGFYNFSPTFIIFVLIIISIMGVVSSYFLPKSNNANFEVRVSLNLIQETINIIKYAHSKKRLYLAILGISWFWFIAAAILAQIPSLTKDILGADEVVANLFIATFSIGVGAGSFLCSKIFKNEITTKYVFISALGISLCGVDLFFASTISAVNYEPEQLKSIFVFLSKKHNWRIVIDLFFLAAIGGLYVVPLFAVMQYFSSPSHRSRVIAANNLINSVFMALSTAILSLLFYFEFSIPFVILMVSLLNMVVACYIYQLVPEAKVLPLRLLKVILRLVFDNMYQVQVKGMENFHSAGKRSVIIANHISYIDPVLLAVYLPANLIFAIDRTVSQVFWVKPFLKFAKALPIDRTNSIAIKTLISEVKKNKKIVIFPEGRISITGSLMKIYEGPGMIADKADATILPIRIDGAQFTHFSKLKNILKRRIFQKIVITILPPVKFKPPEYMDSRLRRKYIAQGLYDVMTDMMFESSDYKKTLFQSLIEAAKIYGFNQQIIQDIDNNSVNYRELLCKSFILSNLIAKKTKEGDYVGLILPNMASSITTFFAMQACGRKPAMLNFTAGSHDILSACKTTGLKVIYTSNKFIETAELQKLVKELIKAGIEVVYLENLRNKITVWLRLRAFIGSYFPQTYYNSICNNHNDKSSAVVIYTSGTEAQPKAVVLSHRNIQANRYQVLAKLYLSPHNLAFNALPMFHCFGLTGAIMMLLGGIRTFFYPSPLHYKVIPEVVYDIGATIMFSTDTFLNGYEKYAHPYDFYSLRYVFTGAEKLKSRTRQSWLDKYGIRIFEGYGATECSPVISANTPMHYRLGTVGRLKPKIERFIEAVEGIQEGGRLYVRGPNIMLGFMHADTPGIIVPPIEEKLGARWYDTGDIVKIDEDGYITILDRAKRFAKIAGEMISLDTIEEIAGKIDKGSMHAAISLKDEKVGEQILLFTTSNIIDKYKFREAVKKDKLSALCIPEIITKISDMPLLATGKIDYRKIAELTKL